MQVGLSPKQFSIAGVVIGGPVLCCLLVLYFTVEQSSTLQLLFSAAVILFSVVFVSEILVRRLPTALNELAENNCFRMNGEKSKRRIAQELKAKGKVRRDFWAIGIAAAALWCGVAFAFHNYFVPIPVAIRGLLAVDGDSGSLVQSLRDAGIERDVESSVQRTYGGGPKSAAEKTRTLWSLTPFIATALVVAGVLTVVGVNTGYRLALEEYRRGLIARQKMHVDRDIRHLQNSELRQETASVT